MDAVCLVVAVVDRLFPKFSYKWLADEVERNLPQELNFRHEASNALRCVCGGGEMLGRIGWALSGLTFGRKGQRERETHTHTRTRTHAHIEGHTHKHTQREHTWTHRRNHKGKERGGGSRCGGESGWGWRERMIRGDQEQDTYVVVALPTQEPEERMGCQILNIQRCRSRTLMIFSRNSFR